MVDRFIGISKLPELKNQRYASSTDERDPKLSKMQAKVNLISDKNKEEFSTNCEIFNVFDKKRGMKKVLYGDTYRSIRHELKNLQGNQGRKDYFKSKQLYKICRYGIKEP